jgi:ADP-ribose pyrophosphatase YjhB (NUDIX family)
MGASSSPERSAVSYTYEYPRPALTVDCVVFGQDEEDLKVLLIRRGVEPFSGRWALPGGFVRMDESLDDAARRELEEESGIRPTHLEQLYTFGAPDRDPRGRVVTVAYFALVKLTDHRPHAATDAREAAWFSVWDTPKLAFDHAEVLSTALQRLKGKVRYQPIGFELLPPKFTLTQLQRLYEIILERPLDKRNFRKKILSLGLLKSEGRTRAAGAHRPARLYAFALGKVKILDGQIV